MQRKIATIAKLWVREPDTKNSFSILFYKYLRLDHTWRSSFEAKCYKSVATFHLTSRDKRCVLLSKKKKNKLCSKVSGLMLRNIFFYIDLLLSFLRGDLRFWVAGDRCNISLKGQNQCYFTTWDYFILSHLTYVINIILLLHI